MNFIFSNHALQELQRRGLQQNMVESVLNNPQQIIEEKEGRKAYQSQVDFGGGKIYLVRVIVADNIDPAVVITAYRTSKITKYWI
ncbi:DUF4258 domain-containing protein [Oscillatoria acuminata]|uniref:DUF4258 domain-containing protein n=1 Tax=Oscillatoria acuminata PCC 6304 TaxID=56110 RepID=K9TRX4_9CYAN|nr:DUF4258 domain-containing protein [Oscillatoria acuminata]AFY85168.1 hypothetical protein Oscil6304_5693 [Oscillatoria acuminata PCC 6304]